ncbi:piRNA biogenesis protein EXD1-like [Thrips palmi]|uniref:PiRNA biogenesis protein EXD1-like n=1 Tax=Thrips palmi TaxID=161013 RepID=A0A6P8Z0A8_THRPL|nr:piRNA biogenesis protein EXD1-like [Thrips palmi]
MNNKMAVNNEFPEFVKGQKLFITLKDNRSLEGTFSRSNSVRKAIILTNVSFIPHHGTPFEQLEFKHAEILQIASLEEENHMINTADQAVAPSSPITKQDGVLYEKVKETVKDLVFVNQIDGAFSEMVRTIERVDCVAVTGEGSNQGRFGHITVLGVATNSTVFLVDIVNLGSTVFKAAGSFLKKTLESNRILKVVHNCSLLSDCLKHKYSINLRNVFDTHACHFIVVKNSSGHPPSSANFEDLVSIYLNLPKAVCETQVADLDRWRRRPLEEGLAEAAAWKVALLRKLKPRLDDALYGPFDSLCKTYLNTVRSLDDDLQVRIALTRQDKFPQEMQSLNGTL